MPAREGKSKEKIKSHINTPEQYEYFKLKNPDIKISKKQYVDFIKKFFDQVIHEIIYDNREFELPFAAGRISVKRSDKELKFKDGKIINTLPVNWDATLKLWEVDEEAKKEKKLVRFLSRIVYRFVYVRNKASFKNKYYYWFKPTRTHKITLKNAIEKDNVEFFNYY